MIVKVEAVTLDGLTPIPVSVQVSMHKGMPTFDIVGMGQTAVKEGKDRILSTLRFLDVPIRNKKIVVNLAPADVRKKGALLDFPIAVGILALLGMVPLAQLENSVFFGELSLDGQLQPTAKAFALVQTMAKASKTIYMPMPRTDLQSVFSECSLRVVSSVGQFIQVLQGQQNSFEAMPSQGMDEPPQYMDMAQVKGQASAKRMLEIAAAGGHHALMAGPPGVGKSMLAKCFPSILPPLTSAQAREVTGLYSACGLDQTFEHKYRPIRMPHHHATLAGMIGGSHGAYAGEMTLAHHGVLFMDEFPEFRRDVIEALREPLEDGWVRIRRAQGYYEYPSQFQLLAAMNLCPCGLLGDPKEQCQCTPAALDRYRKKLSKPILDRMDLSLTLVKVPWQTLWQQDPSETTSAQIQKRVVQARAMQQKRLGAPDACNARASWYELKAHLCMDSEVEPMLDKLTQKHNLSVRSVVKLLRVARTIADLAQETILKKEHLLEASTYRLHNFDL